jgi:hypothetical protein
MSKKRNFFQPESTLGEFGIWVFLRKEFGIGLMVPKSLQNNAEMPHMLFFTLGIDQDVVNEYHNKLIQLRHEYKVHHGHEKGRSIGESKRHNQISIQHILGGEHSLRNIFWMDLNLGITRTKIDLEKDFSTGNLIEKNVDAGQWIFVLYGDGIQRSVVNT